MAHQNGSRTISLGYTPIGESTLYRAWAKWNLVPHNMYRPGNGNDQAAYEKTFGPASQFGYKDYPNVYG